MITKLEKHFKMKRLLTLTLIFLAIFGTYYLSVSLYELNLNFLYWKNGFLRFTTPIVLTFALVFSYLGSEK